jgi:hypothetical protein
MRPRRKLGPLSICTLIKGVPRRVCALSQPCSNCGDVAARLVQWELALARAVAFREPYEPEFRNA